MVVGVSNEAKAKVESFISERGIKYPIALDNAAAKAYGVNGIPDAVLVSPEGKVLWTGHPDGLKEATIEESLQNATFIPSLPPSLARYNALLRAKKFGKAYLDVKKAIQDKKATESDAAQTLGAIEKRMKSLLSEAEKARSESDFYTAGKNLNELKGAFAGTDEARKAEEILGTIEKDPKAREQMKAGDTLAKLDRAMEAKAFVDAQRGYKGLAKKFPGTRIEKIANEKLAFIEKGKLTNYRPTCRDCKKDGKTCGVHRA